MCELHTKEQIDTLWHDTVSNWMERNTVSFQITDMEQYKSWNDMVLVPGPIRIVG